MWEQNIKRENTKKLFPKNWIWVPFAQWLYLNTKTESIYQTIYFTVGPADFWIWVQKKFFDA